MNKQGFRFRISLFSTALLVSCSQAPVAYHQTPTVSSATPTATQDSSNSEQNSSSSGDSVSSNSSSSDSGTSTASTQTAGTSTSTSTSTPVQTTPAGTGSTTSTPDPALAELKKKCTPQVEYVNDGSAGGKKFEQSVPDPKLAMVQAAQYVCSVLYKQAAEVPQVIKVKLFIESMDGVAFATQGEGLTSRELHISSDYLAGLKGDVKLEIDGVMIHENTHIWQNSGSKADGGLIEGVADYVRAGGAWYVPGSRNGSGGKYNDAYTTSAFFLGWLNEKYPDFGYKFNLSMKAYPGPAVFKTITGVDVDTLWNQYQKDGTFSPKVPSWQLKAVPLKLGM